MFWGLNHNLNQSYIYYLLLFFVKSSLPFAALSLGIHDRRTTCRSASSHIDPDIMSSLADMTLLYIILKLLM